MKKKRPFVTLKMAQSLESFTGAPAAVLGALDRPIDFQAVQEALSEAEIEMETAELSMIPQTKMDLAPEQGIKVMGLVDTLDELDDVEKVYTNLNITDEMFELYAQD